MDEKLFQKIAIDNLCLDFFKAQKRILKKGQNCKFALSL